jgi:hypothetical protein
LELRLLNVEDEGCEGQLEGPAVCHVVSIKTRVRVSSCITKKREIGWVLDRAGGEEEGDMLEGKKDRRGREGTHC